MTRLLLRDRLLFATCVRHNTRSIAMTQQGDLVGATVVGLLAGLCERGHCARFSVPRSEDSTQAAFGKLLEMTAERLRHVVEASKTALEGVGLGRPAGIADCPKHGKLDGLGAKLLGSGVKPRRRPAGRQVGGRCVVVTDGRRYTVVWPRRRIWQWWEPTRAPTKGPRPRGGCRRASGSSIFGCSFGIGIKAIYPSGRSPEHLE